MKTPTPEELKEKILEILDKNLDAIESYETYPGTETSKLIVTGKSVVCDKIQDYILSLLPSNEEIKKISKDYSKRDHYSQAIKEIYDTISSAEDAGYHYENGIKDLKQQILNKLK